MVSVGNSRSLRFSVLGLTMAYGVVMWFYGPRLWPPSRFALIIATIVYMFVTLLRSTMRASEPGGRMGDRVRAMLTDPREFWRLHGSVLMMLGVAELGIRSEIDVPRIWTAVNDVLVLLLLVTAIATMTLMAWGVVQRTSRGVL